MDQTESNEAKFLPFQPEVLSDRDALERGAQFFESMDARRSVRFFSDREVPREMIEQAIRTASTAPSGAHRQPWTFVAVSDPAIKKRIRIAAEIEEKKSYEGRMPPEWLAALQPIGTTWEKPYLETIPWIVVAFEQRHSFNEDQSIRKNYYVRESVGLACGLFIASVHQMGLTTLTHTPSPMGFLTEILGRPKNEKPFILFPVGYPSEDCVVPNLARKPLDEVAVWNPVPPKETEFELDPHGEDSE